MNPGRSPSSDLYAVLGVTPTATPAEITHAFRTKLRALHPDTHHRGSPADAQTRLQQVLTAYTLLRDPHRRAIYDQKHPTHTDTVHVTVTHHAPPNQPPPLWAGPVHWQR